MLNLKNLLDCYGIFHFKDFILESYGKYINSNISSQELFFELIECNDTIHFELTLLYNDSLEARNTIKELERLQLADVAIEYRLFANLFLYTLSLIHSNELSEIELKNKLIQMVGLLK